MDRAKAIKSHIFNAKNMTKWILLLSHIDRTKKVKKMIVFSCLLHVFQE